jgi:hypothetical protein
LALPYTIIRNLPKEILGEADKETILSLSKISDIPWPGKTLSKFKPEQLKEFTDKDNVNALTYLPNDAFMELDLYQLASIPDEKLVTLPDVILQKLSRLPSTYLSAMSSEVKDLLHKEKQFTISELCE